MPRRNIPDEMKPTKSAIETDTPLLPYVVADCVVGELERHFRMDFGNRENLIDHLADKAERCYIAAKRQHRPNFYSRIRGATGREYLYSFMRHWLAAEIRRVNGLSAPDSFANGIPLEAK